MCFRRSPSPVVAWAILSVLPAAASAITLAEEGEARATVIVAENAPAPEQHAARELADFLRQVTGGEVAVAHDMELRPPRLLVGEQAARRADPEFTIEGLGAEGLVIRTVGEDLILAGGRPRGTLYAVYTFLEDHVGCRWWAPGATFLPKQPTLRTPPLDIRYVPPLEYRSPFWFSAFEADWAVRNKCNGNRFPLDAERGGKQVIEGFVHTFYPLIPPAKYFKDHPEWFSEIDGRRTHERAQLCLTNEAVRAELVNVLKARLRANPAATMASVSQNDWHGSCQCARCKAVDEEEGSPAGTMLRFVNAVAADIGPEFPDVAISTLAYQYTRKPPKKTRPRDNVVVWLCSIECSFSHPLATDKRNQDFREDIEGWAKVADRLYVWDYTTNFRHYVFPHPNLRVLGPNVKFFAENNVVGLFEQGAYQSPGSEMMELRAWVLAKLLWDPARDAQALIDEFLDGYYGSAAPHIRAYLNLMHDVMQAGRQSLGCFEEPTRKFAQPEVLIKAWQHLEAAENAARTNKELARVRVAQMPMMYALLICWYPADLAWKKAPETVPWPIDEPPDKLFARFMTIARSAGVTMIAEQVTLDEITRRIKLPE